MLYRQIILEWGQDTESGVWGLGYSPDNGKNFYVLNTTHGRKYRAEDGNRLYPYISDQIQDKIDTVVAPAKSAADSAVAYANDAIENSRVNSQAIDDINSAVSDAVSDAAVARSDGLRAWNAAQSNVNLIDLNYASASASISSARTEAIAAANEAKASASAAQADIVAVRSDVSAVQAEVTDFGPALKSAQSDAGKALTQIADTASALSETKAALTSDVAVAKNLANTAQTTADSAIKSASSVANDLAAVASQAKSNANGITKVTSDVGLLQTTVADNSGNISTIQETTKQIQQAVSDNSGNITVAKQTADSAVTVASDAKSNATVAIQTASQASITAKNASGQAASAVFTANGAMTTASNAKSDATVAIQTASGASLTAINANSDATVAKQTASEAKVQASNAESDFAQLSIRAGKIEASVATNSGAIASVQQTANGLTTTVADIKANGGGVNLVSDSEKEFTGKAYNFHGYHLASLTELTPGKTYTMSFMAKVDDKAVNFQQLLFVDIYNNSWSFYTMEKVPISTDYQRITKTFTIPEGKTGVTFISVYLGHPVINGKSDSSADKSDVAGTGYIKEFMLEEGTVAHTWSPAPEDLQNQFTQIKQSIDGITTTINDPKTGLNATYQTAAGNATTISNAQGDIAKLKTRADGFEAEFTTANGNISKLQADATGTTQTLANTKSDIAVLQSRADGLDAKYADAAGDINTLKANASGFSQTLTNAQGDISTLKSTVTGVQNTLTDAQGNISTLQSDVSGLKKTTSDHNGNIATLQATAKTLTSQMSSAQGDISTLKQTASGISSQVTSLSDSAMQNRGTVDSPDFNSLTQAGYYTITSPSNGKNYPASSWGTLEVSGQVTDINGRLNQKYVSDNNGMAYTRQYNANTKGWTAWVKVANQNDINTLNGKITTNSTAIEQNKKAIALKADQTTVDKANGDVQQLQSQLKVQAGQIASKVSSSDLDAKGYATQTYTQTQIKQTADTWNANLTSVKNGLTDKYTNLHATVDGIQAQVYNSDGSSKITQLSNVIQTKVGTDDFNNLKQAVGLQTLESADINNMKTTGHYFVHNLSNNPIGGWVYVDVTGDGSSRIRQDVYQDNGSEHKYRRWVDTKWTDWEEGATYSEINQLKDDINLRVTKGDLISQINLQAGTALIQSNKLALDAGTTVFTGSAFIPSAAIESLDASKVTFYGADNTYATMGASVAQYDDDKQKSTINLQYNGGIEIHSSNQQGSILTMHDNTIRLASKSWGDNSNPYQYSGFYAAPNYSLMNTYHRDGTTSGVAIDDNQIHIYGSSKDNQLGALKADVGWYSINGKTGSLTGNQISLKATTTQVTLSDRNINIENTIDTNSNNYDVAIHVKGWAEMTGWFTCMGMTQTSLLSTKTRIEPLDTKVALDKIVSANVNTYQFKTDVAKGKTKRHASVVIDDVHDVAEYCTPEEFISEDRKGRDDGDIIGYLMGAVQELSKQLNEVKEKI
ncbi:UNVERIFIED_CONTAM: hypothetical protein DV033_01735 [Limosilactobacillus fermentum]|uniref:Peptidase S74 domain-containing protein n=1 Tax=Limosilactobacillus fermentum TaxID=1613 RepID=A0AAJ6A200_LIMFE|nr:hypothetical protein [Limosilactobacillus fermentum]MED7634561.1 hypothetical protein [Limosilactobacillus fermentum]WFR90196.1 hypothetical protein P8634_10950 [Limosilactobacillus fermentum]